MQIPNSSELGIFFVRWRVLPRVLAGSRGHLRTSPTAPPGRFCAWFSLFRPFLSGFLTPGNGSKSTRASGWQAHFDYSKALEEDGVKPTLISAGKYKVEGNPYVPLDAEAQTFMQSRVDDYYDAFVKAVAKGRGVSVAEVRDGMGQGRVLGADAALAQKMVDGIATFDEVLTQMQKKARASQVKGATRLAQARASLVLI